MNSHENAILDWDLITLSNVYKERRISPVEVVQLTLQKIKEKSDTLNTYITVCHETALEQAQQVEKEFIQGIIKGPLHGVPIALKDLIYTKDARTTMGSGAYKDFIPAYDATIVTKLKEAGAIIIGKTNTHELAYGPTGDYSYFGPIKNPWDISKMAGGSSGGSAAAVSLSLSYVAIGTDTSGSVRIPASCCGIVGMKPTFGRVSKYGVYPLSWTMDHIGPMTRNIMDNALLLNCLIGHDKNDPYSLASKPENFTSKMMTGVEGCTIGVPLSPFFEQVQEEVKEQVLKSIQLFEQLGAKVKIISIPFMEDILEACKIVTRSEAYVVNKELALDYQNLLGEQIRERILLGANYSASEYVASQQIKNEATRRFDKLFEEVDVIVTPTIPILPPNIGAEEVEINNSIENVRASLIRLTCPSNLIGFPSLTVPCGFSGNLPVGMQLIGRRYDEANLYRFGYAFEQIAKNI